MQWAGLPGPTLFTAPSAPEGYRQELGHACDHRQMRNTETAAGQEREQTQAPCTRAQQLYQQLNKQPETESARETAGWAEGSKPLSVQVGEKARPQSPFQMVSQHKQHSAGIILLMHSRKKRDVWRFTQTGTFWKLT